MNLKKAQHFPIQIERYVVQYGFVLLLVTDVFFVNFQYFDGSRNALKYGDENRKLTLQYPPRSPDITSIDHE